MASNAHPTICTAPHSPLDVELSLFPSTDSLAEKYQTSLLLEAVLRDAWPHIDLAAWLRHKRAGSN